LIACQGSGQRLGTSSGQSAFLNPLDKGMRIIMLAFDKAQPDYAENSVENATFMNFNAQE
jgi:hypothetical protein